MPANAKAAASRKWDGDRTYKWSAAQICWASEQETSGVPRIEQTVKALTPSGRAVEANRFDFNLAYCTNRYVQLTDGSWMKARALLPPRAAAA